MPSQPARRARLHTRSATGFLPLDGTKLEDVYPPESDKAAWKKAVDRAKVGSSVEDIEASIVRHIQSTLARAAYNVDSLAMYQATALSCRDEMIARWNATQMYHTIKVLARIDAS